jgi:hypothetical protein
MVLARTRDILIGRDSVTYTHSVTCSRSLFRVSSVPTLI